MQEVRHASRIRWFRAPTRCVLPALAIALSSAKHSEHRHAARTPSDPDRAELAAWSRVQHESRERMHLVAGLEPHADPHSAGALR
jgi:hypothetical protein